MNRTARFSDKLFVRSQRWFNLAGFCGAIALSVLACWFTTRQLSANADEPAALPPIKLLFLGDNQPRQHVPRIRYNIIKPVLEQRNITIDYTADMADINPEKLAKYDGLVVYANIDTISPEAAKALVDYVESGKGFIPLHCASYCFRNSPEVVALIGGQFLRHSTGTFRTELANTDHPVMRGFGGFESWDETYTHTKHNEVNRTVLEYRVDNSGREPFTWVRTQGKGRVFYTAWGHDERTWNNPGFQNLVERGIRWAVGGDPGLVPAFSDAKTAARLARNDELAPDGGVEMEVRRQDGGARHWHAGFAETANLLEFRHRRALIDAAAERLEDFERSRRDDQGGALGGMFARYAVGKRAGQNERTDARLDIDHVACNRGEVLQRLPARPVGEHEMEGRQGGRSPRQLGDRPDAGDELAGMGDRHRRPLALLGLIDGAANERHRHGGEVMECSCIRRTASGPILCLISAPCRNEKCHVLPPRFKFEHERASRSALAALSARRSHLRYSLFFAPIKQK